MYLIWLLNQEGDTTRHRPISTSVEAHKDHVQIYLTWQAQARSEQNRSFEKSGL